MNKKQQTDEIWRQRVHQALAFTKQLLNEETIITNETKMIKSMIFDNGLKTILVTYDDGTEYEFFAESASNYDFLTRQMEPLLARTMVKKIINDKPTILKDVKDNTNIHKD